MKTSLQVALLKCENESQVSSILEDLLTDFQLREMSARFEAALRLSRGVTYRDASEATGLSMMSIQRVAAKLQHGNGLKQIFGKWQPDKTSYMNRAKYYQ